MLKEKTGDGTWAGGDLGGGAAGGGGLVVGDEAHASIFPPGSRPSWTGVGQRSTTSAHGLVGPPRAGRKQSPDRIKSLGMRRSPSVRAKLHG